MMLRLLAILCLLLLSSIAMAAPPTPCATGVTNCSNDTQVNELFRQIANDPNSQTRVYGLWNNECTKVFTEATTVTNHTARVAFCGAVVGQKVPMNMLVYIVLNDANNKVQPEVLINYPIAASPLLGNMTDIDAENAIDAAITGYGLAGTWPAP